MTTSTLRRRTSSVDARRGAGGGPHQLLCRLAQIPHDHPSRSTVRGQVIEAWLPLAERLARRFHGRGVPLEDLTQVASIGLIKAVDRFDIGRGNGFGAFATPTILGEIRRHFRDLTWDLRVPRRLKELRAAVKTSNEGLAQQLGHHPTTGELAADLDVSQDEVVECLGVSAAHTAMSLDAPAPGGDQAAELGETVGEPDTDLALAELRMTLGPALSALPAREQWILQMRFIGNLTQTEIAERVGVSQMHVSRLLSRSLAMLRETLTNDETDSPRRPEAG